MSPQTSFAISYTRFIALICILLHHAFCVYSGWPPNIGVTIGLPESFEVISAACKGIGMVAFCFISGMLVSYSFDRINRTSKIHEIWARFILKKFKRLIIPALVWGGVYAVFFNEYMLTVYYPGFINGTHLWFLPMLFLLMLSISPVMYSRYLWIVPVLLFIIFLFRSQSRTTSEFVLYFPSFASGFLFSAITLRNTFGKKIKSYIFNSWPIIAAMILYVFLSRYNDMTLSYAIYLAVVVTLILLFRRFYGTLRPIFDLHPIKFATKESFTVYIVHQFVIILFSFIDIPALSTATIFSVSVYFLICYSGSLMIARFFSRLRGRYKLVEFVI